MMSHSNLLSNKCLPFIIGVTGHRDLDNTDDANQQKSYKERIKTALLYWREVVGTNTPIWLMTGLAAGADTLAAQAAIELQNSSEIEDLRIIGCLPMPLEQYKADFDNLSYAPSAVDDLEKLIDIFDGDKNQLFVIRHHLDDEQYQCAINDTNYGPLRNSLYLNLGLFIAKYSNVLLAIWDGQPALGVGGTSDVVMYKLGANVQWPDALENTALKPVSDFDGQTSGLVHHIHASRRGKSSPALQDATLPFSRYETSTPAPFGDIYTSLADKNDIDNQYQRDFLSTEFETLVSQLTVHNSKANVVNIASVHDSGAGLKDSHSIFLTADTLAISSQSVYRKCVLFFFFLAIPGYVLYELAGGYLNSTIGLGVFTFILLIMLSCWRVIKYAAKKDLKWHYQLARGVAEAMRIRGFLNLADIEPSSTNLIPRRFRLHLPLLNHAIAIAELDWWKHKDEYQPQQLKQRWVQDQLNFLKSRLEHRSSSIKELVYKRPSYAAMIANRSASFLFNGAIAIGVALAGLMALQLTLPGVSFVALNEWLLVLLQYSLMIAGLILLWNELAGYDMTAKGYESLEELYRRASILLSDDITPSQKQMLLDLAREAMFEHVTWTSSESNNDLKQKN